MTTKQHRELEYAFFVLTVLSGVYVAYTVIAVRSGGAPAGSHPFGHWLGIIGTILMVMTETLYSIRKRTALLDRTGPVRKWLSFHIFTGIVGPFLVLMHSGLQFRGLAGVTMALTILIVLSGFIGRYLYGAVQRAGQHSSDSYAMLAQQIGASRQQLDQFDRTRPARVRLISSRWQEDSRESLAIFNRWHQFRMERQLRKLETERHVLEAAIKRLLQRKLRIERELERNEGYQRLFSLWHLAHIPLGITLFVAIAIHVMATIFFRAGLFG